MTEKLWFFAAEVYPSKSLIKKIIMYDKMPMLAEMVCCRNRFHAETYQEFSIGDKQNNVPANFSRLFYDF